MLWASTATGTTARVVVRITSVLFICLAFLWKYISLDDDREILCNAVFYRNPAVFHRPNRLRCSLA